MKWIGVTKDGKLLLNKHDVSRADKKGMLAAWAEVTDSQINHRCAVLLDGKWQILTPSEAQFENIEKIKYFPEAKELSLSNTHRPSEITKYDSRKLKKIKSK